MCSAVGLASQFWKPAARTEVLADLLVRALHTCPVPARPALVYTLKAIDDRFWGVVRQKRVRWLGYDSGIKPGEQACTVVGCTADHESVGTGTTQFIGQIGYYASLEENTSRFVKRG